MGHSRGLSLDEERHQSTSSGAGASHPPDGRFSRPSGSNLKRAIHRARVDEAERTQVISDMRGAEYAQLEILEEALTPLLAELPENLDLFDVAIMPGEHPRLFIDMIGFVEMGRDLRSYRLIQDTRHGRFIITETANIEKMVDAVTDYMGRRLIEREKALAADRSRFPARPKRSPESRASGISGSGGAFPAYLRPKLFSLFNFLLDVLGSAAFFTLFAIGGFFAWKFIASWISVYLKF